MKRYWTRSDWPLYTRIIGPMSGRVRCLRGTAWTISLAEAVDQRRMPAADSEKLKYVAADQARDAGLPVRRGEFPFSDWINAIQGQLDRYLPADEATRREAADRLRSQFCLSKSARARHWLPGSSRGWRSASG
jgi:hypothetical protein